VRHLLYISSYLPDAGSSQGSIMSGETDPVAIAPRDDGTLTVSGYTPTTFGARFWQDLDDEALRAGAWDRVTTQSLAAFGTPTSRTAWQGRPSTALVCTEDRSTSLALQRFYAARATRAVELPTGHHPFLSHPELVTEQLLTVLQPR
jgi:pimeloyl-ACP methyl ester carboxylesterase